MRLPVDNFDKWYNAHGFGVKTPYGYHCGCDLNLKTGGDTDLGQPLRAIADGVVTSIHNHATGFGKHIHIKHEGAWGTVWSHYAHCDNIFVGEGGNVVEGQKIATLGKTGTMYAHCHFAIKLQPTGVDGVAKTLEDLKKWTDPLAFINKWSATIDQPANSGSMPNSNEPVTGDQTKIDLGNPQGVLEIQAIRSRIKDGEEAIVIYQHQVEDLGKLIDDLKSSYGQGIIKLTEKEKATKETFDNFLFKMAGLLGENQDIPTIIASLTALVKENSDLKKKLEGITSSQPIVIHNGLDKVVEFINRLISNLKKKYGKTKKGRKRASVE